MPAICIGAIQSHIGVNKIVFTSNVYLRIIKSDFFVCDNLCVVHKFYACYAICEEVDNAKRKWMCVRRRT